MTALLGLLAVAGYQNRDKLSEMLGNRSERASPESLAGGGGLGEALGGLLSGQGGASSGGGLGGLLAGLGGGSGSGAGGGLLGGLLGGGLGQMNDRFRQAGHGDRAALCPT